jgi:hypothetical protein
MKRKWKIVIASVVGVYAIFPFIAGALELGARRGPVFYPSDYHSTLFILGCESFHDYKPRQGPASIFYRKALFYGLPERPYPKEKRIRMIEERRAKGMNERIVKLYEETEARISEFENEN